MRVGDHPWHPVHMSDTQRPTTETRGSRRRAASFDSAESVTFDRDVSLFDAVYGFAMTLLIANVDPPPAEAWASLEALAASEVGTQILGFTLSFVVIAVVWRANVRLVRRLSGMDGVVTGLNLLAAAMVILIAFTTQGISDSATSDLPLPTILYAVNIAAVSMTQTVMYQVARARGLEDPRLPNRQNRREVLVALITPLVFLASVPVALVDASTAKLTWAAIAVLNPVAAVLLNRRADTSE